RPGPEYRPYWAVRPRVSRRPIPRSAAGRRLARQALPDRALLQLDPRVSEPAVWRGDRRRGRSADQPGRWPARVWRVLAQGDRAAVPDRQPGRNPEPADERPDHRLDAGAAAQDAPYRRGQPCGDKRLAAAGYRRSHR